MPLLGTRFITRASAEPDVAEHALALLDDRYFADVVVKDRARCLELIGLGVPAEVLEVLQEFAPFLGGARRSALDVRAVLYEGARAAGSSAAQQQEITRNSLAECSIAILPLSTRGPALIPVSQKQAEE